MFGLTGINVDGLKSIDMKGLLNVDKDFWLQEVCLLVEYPEVDRSYVLCCFSFGISQIDRQMDRWIVYGLRTKILIIIKNKIINIIRQINKRHKT